MKEKIKSNNYFLWGLTIFLAIGASILLYFLCLRMGNIASYIGKILNILSPIMIGMLFAYLLNPLVKLLENKVIIKFLEKHNFKIKNKHKLARAFSIFITYLMVIIVIALFFIFVLPSLFESLEMMLTNIPAYLNNISDYLKDTLKNNAELAKVVDEWNSDITSSLANLVMPSMDTILLNLTQGITSLISGLVTFIIALIVSVYLIYDKEEFIRGFKKCLKVLVPERAYDAIMTTLTYTDKIFGGFLIAKVIDSLIVGIVTFIFLSIFGIPYALIISVIVGVTNVIPYFGPFIGAVPCTVLLLLIDPKKALIFVILIFIIQQLDGNILEPKLIGNKTGIKSFWVLFSILLFGGIFGFLGMIFGVPIFAVIYSLLKRAIDQKLLAKNKAK